LHEFQLIDRFFKPLACADVPVPLGDDAAVVRPVDAQAVCTDTLVAGRHFLPDAPADAVAWKALAVNVSDLIAMNAAPRFYTLALTLPWADEAWLAQFASGLEAAQKAFGCCLLGGDTTRGDTLTLSITALGTLRDKPWRRNGARPGDALMLTGPVGTAALGLKALLGEVQASKAVIDAQLRPRPPLQVWQALAGQPVNAAIDISDGLLQDAGHLARASGVGLRIEVERLPLHPEVVAWCEQRDDWSLPLSGGEDYQLLLSVPQQAATEIARAGLAIRIGTVTVGSDVVALWRGRPLQLTTTGFRHF